MFQDISFNSNKLGDEAQKNDLLRHLLEDFAKPELNMRPSRIGKLKELCRNITGAANVRISTDKASGDLSDVCATLLELYGKDTYTTTFPALLNVSPVRDPVITKVLNGKLIDAVHAGDEHLTLTVPEIQDFNANFGISYAGAGVAKAWDDANLDDYFQYLADHGQDPADLTLDDLKKHEMLITNDDGSQTHKRYPVQPGRYWRAADGRTISEHYEATYPHDDEADV